MTPAEQRAIAAAESKRVRGEAAAVRVAMRTSYHAALSALMDPPECIHGRMVLEVIAMTRAVGMRADHLTEIGREAVRDGINLTVRMGRASLRTRLWAVEHGLRHVHYPDHPNRLRPPRPTPARDVVVDIVRMLGGRATVADICAHEAFVWSHGYAREALRGARLSGGLVRVGRSVYELPDHIESDVRRREAVAV